MEKKKWDPAVILPLCITCILVFFVVIEIFYLILQIYGCRHMTLLLLTAYLACNVIGNMVKFVQTNPTIKGVLLENDNLGKGWVYCYSCQIHIPPRCHHCFDCHVCVLRRDHHCTLLGKCVGYANYRYFFCTLVHGWLALLLATFINAEVFMELLHEGISFHSLFLLLMPWMMLVTGQVSFSTFMFAFVADTCVVGFLFCFVFFTLHSVLLYRGSTTKEWFVGQTKENYDLGWKKNVREYLGERWYLVWLSPWVDSKLSGDGITFYTRPIFESFSKSANL